MKTSLRHWCLAGEGPPPVGAVLHLEELDPAGAPTGRRVRVRVEASPAPGPARASSTQRLFAVDVPTEWPRLCRCGHVRVLHAPDPEHPTEPRGPCTLCTGLDTCDRYRPADPREEP